VKHHTFERGFNLDGVAPRGLSLLLIEGKSLLGLLHGFSRSLEPMKITVSDP
jgi:hypothetical protein